MKKIVLALVLLSLSAAAFCREPVGYTVPFDQKGQLRAESPSTYDVVAFPGSSFVKVHLRELHLGENDALVVSDGFETVATITGPYSGGGLWLPSVSSGAACLTLENKDGKGAASYTIDQVGIGFNSVPEPESICQNDDRKNAACYGSDLYTAGLSVGRMLFSDGGGWYLCTGSLVSPNGHFLTNNHCIEDQYGADSLEVWWKYESPDCVGYSGTKEYVTTGSDFITTDESLDFTLLQITDSQLFAKYGYLKIAARPAVVGEPIWIPQHGGGTVKKFAVESDLDGGVQAKVVVDDIEGYQSHSDMGYWADTEGGSSGSPVLDANNKILALHHFGLPSGAYCDTTYMNQGVKMSLIYPKIAEYLGGIIPPSVNTVTKAVDPFRLILKGTNFNAGMTVYIGSDSTPWPYYSYKSPEKFVVKGNKALRDRFPKGTPVDITVVNPDSGTATVTYTR